MKNYILFSDDKQLEFESIEELKKYMMGDLYTSTIEDQQKFFYEKVFGFSVLNNLQIIETTKGVYGSNYEIKENEKVDYNKAIIINNFDTYLLSLCKFNIIVFLEEKDHRKYTININAPEDDKYVIVNAFANEILHEMVGGIQ